MTRRRTSPFLAFNLIEPDSRHRPPSSGHRPRFPACGWRDSRKLPRQMARQGSPYFKPAARGAGIWAKRPGSRLTSRFAGVRGQEKCSGRRRCRSPDTDERADRGTRSPSGTTVGYANSCFNGMVGPAVLPTQAYRQNGDRERRVLSAGGFIADRTQSGKTLTAALARSGSGNRRMTLRSRSSVSTGNASTLRRQFLGSFHELEKCWKKRSTAGQSGETRNLAPDETLNMDIANENIRYGAGFARTVFGSTARHRNLARHGPPDNTSEMGAWSCVRQNRETERRFDLRVPELNASLIIIPECAFQFTATPPPPLRSLATEEIRHHRANGQRYADDSTASPPPGARRASYRRRPWAAPAGLPR